MKCGLCKDRAESHVLFRRENASEPGYVAFDDEIVFDSNQIGKFVYYLAEKGLHTGRRGVVDLCHRHLTAVRANRN